MLPPAHAHVQTDRQTDRQTILDAHRRTCPRPDAKRHGTPPGLLRQHNLAPLLARQVVLVAPGSGAVLTNSHPPPSAYNCNTPLAAAGRQSHSQSFKLHASSCFKYGTWWEFPACSTSATKRSIPSFVILTSPATRGEAIGNLREVYGRGHEWAGARIKMRREGVGARGVGQWQGDAHDHNRPA